ncbi:MAG: aminoacyl-tRNA hydrolase [Proteobacteria bacterium]|jgi:PTH1 family peptidyl-tRNA hydrolase|nr:aminoacyl-tRNA hydrolase [Pseudomonadota bacterium]
MKLIVGLGNPGPKYETTRHNAGFLLLDQIAQRAKINWEASKFQGLIGRGSLWGESSILLKPLTFMNLSGRSVGAVMRFFKIEVRDLVVIFDDVDVPAGKVRARVGGGHGGHNGVRSIIDETGLVEFHRLKLGVGRPPEGWDTADWVLGAMTDTELLGLQEGMLKDVDIRMKQIFDHKM